MQPQNGIDKKETAAGDTTAAHKNIGTNGAENSANGSAVNSEILRLSRLPYVEYQPEQDAHARRLGLPLDELNDRIARVKQSGLDELTPLPQLLDTVVAMLCKYVVFPLKAQAEVIALWTLHTWVFEAADFTPYLWITAASKRSGKTRVLDVLAFLAKNAEKDESASSASLIRSIDEKNPPTFLLDEIDKLYTGRANGDGEANNTCRLLNAGYERDATFRRCVGQGAAIEAKKFPAFCPKVICGIKCQIPDTVLDRSITIELVRQTRENRAERLRKREAKAVLAPIADKIKAWATFPGVIQDLKAARPELPDELHDRAQDICEPLLAIADLAGGNWPQSARDALVKLYKGVEDEDDGVKLLSAIKDIFDEKGCDRLSTKDLLGELVALEDGPWAAWFEDALKHDKVKTAGAKLARELKRYKHDGVKRHKFKIGEESVWGYTRDCFKKVWERYLPPSKKEGTKGTKGTGAHSTRENPGSQSEAFIGKFPVNHEKEGMTGTGNVPSNGEKQGTENHEAKSEKVPRVPRVPSNGTEDKNRSITMEEFYAHAAEHKAANTQVEDLGVQYPLFPGQKPQSGAVSRLLGRKGQ